MQVSWFQPSNFPSMWTMLNEQSASVLYLHLKKHVFAVFLLSPWTNVNDLVLSVTSETLNMPYVPGECFECYFPSMTAGDASQSAKRVKASAIVEMQLSFASTAFIILVLSCTISSMLNSSGQFLCTPRKVKERVLIKIFIPPFPGDIPF